MRRAANQCEYAPISAKVLVYSTLKQLPAIFPSDMGGERPAKGEMYTFCSTRQGSFFVPSGGIVIAAKYTN